MTWTYDGAPGTDTAAQRRDSVRVLTGDTDTNDQQSTDEEIAFALTQSANDVYGAGSIIARALAAKFSRFVDTSVDSAKTMFSSRVKNYTDIAKRLDVQARKYGLAGLGTPAAGGLTESGMESADEDDDRVQPAFRVRQFRNPPRFDDDLDRTD